MTRIACFVIALCLISPTSGSAQEKKPPVAPTPPAVPVPAIPTPSEVRGQPANVRIDVTIVDEGGAAPSRKSVSLTVADRQLGSVRAIVISPGVPEVPLNVDATPIIEGDGRVRARISLDYRPNPGSDSKSPATPQIRVTFGGVLLTDGKKIVASQAADPTTDRRVSVELTATILRP